MNFVNSIFDLNQQQTAVCTNPSCNLGISKLWIRQREFGSRLSSASVLKLFMGKKSSDSTKISLRAFEVTKNELVYRKDKFDSKIKGVLTLNRLRILFEPIDEVETQIISAGFQYQMKAMRDGRFTVMYLRNQEDLSLIKSALWGKVIYTSFLEDFKIDELIGTGGFAKVRFALRIRS